MPQVAHPSRDAVIVDSFRRGVKIAKIADTWELTPAHIYQIIKKGAPVADTPRQAVSRQKALMRAASRDEVPVMNTAPVATIKVAEACPSWLIDKVQGLVVERFTSGLNGNLAEVSAALTWLAREVK